MLALEHEQLVRVGGAAKGSDLPDEVVDTNQTSPAEQRSSSSPCNNSTAQTSTMSASPATRFTAATPARAPAAVG